MPHEVLVKLIDLLHNPFAGATLLEHMLASLKRFGMGFGLPTATTMVTGMAFLAFLESIILGALPYMAISFRFQQVCERGLSA